MLLELGNAADIFRLSASYGTSGGDLDPALLFSAKYRPAIAERFTASGGGGTIYFSRAYPYYPVVVGFRSDGLYPFRDKSTKWNGKLNVWYVSSDSYFRFFVYTDRLDWQSTVGGTYTFFVIGNIA